MTTAGPRSSRSISSPAPATRSPNGTSGDLCNLSTGKTQPTPSRVPAAGRDDGATGVDPLPPVGRARSLSLLRKQPSCSEGVQVCPGLPRPPMECGANPDVHRDFGLPAKGCPETKAASSRCTSGPHSINGLPVPKAFRSNPGFRGSRVNQRLMINWALTITNQRLSQFARGADVNFSNTVNRNQGVAGAVGGIEAQPSPVLSRGGRGRGLIPSSGFMQESGADQ